MDDIKTLNEYAVLIRENKNSPHILAELQIDCAAKFAFLADIAKDLQLEKAAFWSKKFEGEKPLSDAHLEHQWRLTEGGKKEIKMKYELKGLEHLMAAIKTSSVVNSVEMRMQQ